MFGLLAGIAFGALVTGVVGWIAFPRTTNQVSMVPDIPARSQELPGENAPMERPTANEASPSKGADPPSELHQNLNVRQQEMLGEVMVLGLSVKENTEFLLTPGLVVQSMVTEGVMPGYPQE